MENSEKIFLIVRQKDTLKFDYFFQNSGLLTDIYSKQLKDSKNNDLYSFLVSNILDYTDFFKELMSIESLTYGFFVGDLYRAAIFENFSEIDKILKELKKIQKINFDNFFIRHIVGSIFDSKINLSDLFIAFARNGLDIATKKYFNKNIVQAILEQKVCDEQQIHDILLSFNFLKNHNFDFNLLDYNQRNLIDYAYSFAADIRIIKWLNDEVTVVSGSEDVYFSNYYRGSEAYNNYLINRDIFEKYPLLLDIGILKFKQCNLAFPKELKNIYLMNSLKKAIENKLGFCSKLIYKSVKNKLVYISEDKQIINHHLFVFLELIAELLVYRVSKKNINLIVKLIDNFDYISFGYETNISENYFSKLRNIVDLINEEFVEKLFVGQYGICNQMFIINDIVGKNQQFLAEYASYFKKYKLHKKLNNIDEFRENIDSYMILRSTKEESFLIMNKNNINFEKYTFKQAQTNIELILWGINQKNCVGNKKYSESVLNFKIRIYGIFVLHNLVGVLSVDNLDNAIIELQILGFSKEENDNLKNEFMLKKIFGGI